MATTKDAIHSRFAGLAPARIALEVGGHSAWVSELLRDLGHEVIVANARKLRMIFQSNSKTDQLDALQLARVARLDPELLYGIRHRGRSARADLAIMRSRDALVATRTKLVNHVHGVLKSFGHRAKKHAAPSFHRQAAGQIPDELLPRTKSRPWRDSKPRQSRFETRAGTAQVKSRPIRVNRAVRATAMNHQVPAIASSDRQPRRPKNR